jgi:Holliday junction resolvasome RuvABC endonuclease subunit
MPSLDLFVIEQEKVKHYLPSQIFHTMRGAGSAEGAQLHAYTIFLLSREGDEEREDIIAGHMYGDG